MVMFGSSRLPVHYIESKRKEKKDILLKEYDTRKLCEKFPVDSKKQVNLKSGSSNIIY